MPDCDSVPIQTVRVYLKRLPSGAYRATVLSPSLPRPVFRMYPAGTSEAEAVARAVGRALSPPDTKTEQACREHDGTGLKKIIAFPYEASEKDTQQHSRNNAHLSPPFPRSEQQPADEQRDADNQRDGDNWREKTNGYRYLDRVAYAHDLPPAIGVDGCCHHSPEEAGNRHGQPEDRLVAVEGDEATQHRRPQAVRVTWQGLL